MDLSFAEHLQIPGLSFLLTSLIGFFISLVAMLIITPRVMHLATQGGVIAQRSARRRHERDTPLLGGVAAMLAISVGLVAVVLMQGARVWDLAPYLLPAALIAGVGIWDDIRQLRAKPKFVIELLAAGLFLAFQHERLAAFGLPLWAYPLVYAVLVLFIVGVTNALNMIDGMDGLCSGLSGIAATSLFVIGLILGIHSPLILYFMPLMLGSTVGFLFFNRHPAKIFLGDSGSLPLGFILAVTVVDIALRTQSLQGVIAAGFALTLPVFDMLWVMAGRYRSKRPVFSGDATHIHHRLGRLGLGPTGTVGAIWLIAILLSTKAVMMARMPVDILIAAFVSNLAILGLFYFSLSFFERRMSIQMTKYGQAALGSTLPELVALRDFIKTLKHRVEQTIARDQGIHLLSIDYLQIMPQLFQESPELVDSFFRETYQTILRNLRSDDLIVRLSDTLTAVILIEDEPTVGTQQVVLARIRGEIQALLEKYRICSNDLNTADGVTLTGLPDGLVGLCRRLKVPMSEFRDYAELSS